MTKNEQVLVDFWVEIGKVRKEIYDPYDPAQGYRYFFINDWMELELKDTWVNFFLAFNSYNHLYFQSGIEGAEILLNGVDVTEDIIPFDPWENPHFISLEIPKVEFGGSNQIYRCIDVLKN